MAATHLEAVLNRVSLPDDPLTELAKRFSELDATTALVRGCVGGRCCVIDFSKHPARGFHQYLKICLLPRAKVKSFVFKSVGSFRRLSIARFGCYGEIPKSLQHAFP